MSTVSVSYTVHYLWTVAKRYLFSHCSSRHDTTALYLFLTDLLSTSAEAELAPSSNLNLNL